MRKLLKGILIAGGILVGVAMVGLVAINLYVQSVGVQERLEHALSSALKVPVHVASTIVTPWSGLKASGITVPQAQPAAGQFVEAASFSAHFDWLKLFEHRLDASRATLQRPVVTWLQSPGGRWELPEVEAQPAASPAPAPEGAGQEKGPRGKPWGIHVRRLAVEDGCFDFWDEKGNRLLEFSGVYLECLNPAAEGTQGYAVARNVALRDRLFFQNMRTNVTYNPQALRLEDFQTDVGGGDVRGEAQVAVHTRHSPFTLDVAFDKVDVNQLMKEGGQPAGQITGMLNGVLDLSGNSGKRSSMNGSGHLELTGGRMQGIELFQVLGQGLQIPDLVELNLRTAEADVRVVSGVTYVDRLALESQSLRLDARGTIESDGKLALDARLTVSERISGRLPSFILTYFKEGAAGRYIDFGITNTLTHPRTNLLDNILGRRIESQMTDILSNIFGKRHLKRMGLPEAAPGETPAASPGVPAAGGTP